MFRKAEQASLIEKVPSVSSQVPLTRNVSFPNEEEVSMMRAPITPEASAKPAQSEVSLFDDDEEFTKQIVKKGRRVHKKRVNGKNWI